MPVPTEIDWRRLVSQCVFELRTPMNVAEGYLKLTLKEAAGMNERHRGFLEGAIKSWARARALINEMDDLERLDRSFVAGEFPFKRLDVDLRKVLRDVVASLRVEFDTDPPVDLKVGDGPAVVQGNVARLKSALTSLLEEQRRQVLDGGLFVRDRPSTHGGKAVTWVVMADAGNIDQLDRADPVSLTEFDGRSVRVTLARRIIELHGGTVWSASHLTRAAAVVALPLK